MWNVVQINDPQALKATAADVLGPEMVLALHRNPPDQVRGMAVHQEGQVVLVLLGELLSPARAFLHLPAARQGLAVPGETMTQVGAILDRWCAPEPKRLWQALVPPEEQAFWAPWLCRWGFQRLSAVEYWEHPLEAAVPESPFAPQQLLRPGELGPESAATLLEQTAQESLDFPELQGWEDPQGVLESYRRTGSSGDRFWYAVRGHPGTPPLGMLLLAQHGRGAGVPWELVYLGVVPWHRGCGWGRRMVQHALHVAAAHAARELFLGVDVRNRPARWLYRRLGFRQKLRREVFCRR